MNVYLFFLSCIFIISFVVLVTLASIKSVNANHCVNDVNIYCYKDWSCNNDGDTILIRDAINDLLTACNSEDSTTSSCLCLNWLDTIGSSGPNGNFGATGSYDPSKSSSNSNVCGLFE